MLSRRRDVDEAEDGYSLIELLVVIILLSIVGSVILAGIVQTSRTNTAVSVRTTSLTDLQKAVERMARDLRTADPLEPGTAGGSTLQVRIFRGSACSRVGYYLSGTTLMKETQTGLTPTPATLGAAYVNSACSSGLTSTPPTTGAGVSTAVVATGLDASLPLFTYYDASGTVITSPPATASVARIAVTITLAVTSNRGAKSLGTSVLLRNYGKAP